VQGGRGRWQMKNLGGNLARISKTFGREEAQRAQRGKLGNLTRRREGAKEVDKGVPQS